MLVMAFTVAVAACGGDGTSNSSTPFASSTPSASSTPAASSKPAATSAPTSEPAVTTAVADALTLSAANYSVVQNAGSVTVTVTRSGDASAAATIDYATADGTALAGSDYTAVTGTLQWAVNESSIKTVAIPISNAAPFFGNKSFSITLSNPTSTAELASPDVATVTISGDATTAGESLQFTSASYPVAQTAANLSVNVSRAGGSAGAITVAYATSNGTAIAGSDFTATSGTLVWADGDAAPKTFSIPISDAAPFSGTKSFAIALSKPGNGVALGTPNSAGVVIAGAAAPTTTSIKSPVYLNGKFYWAGDWNTIAFNYAQSGAGVDGAGPVIGMPGDQEWEYWLPYPPNNPAGPASNGVNFDLSGLTYFTVAIKPSRAGALAQMQFFRADGGTDDIPYGTALIISQAKYGPATMIAGQWNVYTIPLADFGVSGWIYKFILQQQGVSPQSWEIDQVGFE